MGWVGFYVGIAVAGLLVLSAVGFRLFRQVRQLARDLKAASARISDASDEMARQRPAPGGRA